MGVRRFFLSAAFFRWAAPEQRLEEIAALCYHAPGFSYDLGEATPGERESFVKWVIAQKKREKAAMDAAQKK